MLYVLLWWFLVVVLLWLFVFSIGNNFRCSLVELCIFFQSEIVVHFFLWNYRSSTVLGKNAACFFYYISFYFGIFEFSFKLCNSLLFWCLLYIALNRKTSFSKFLKLFTPFIRLWCCDSQLSGEFWYICSIIIQLKGFFFKSFVINFADLFSRLKLILFLDFIRWLS